MDAERSEGAANIQANNRWILNDAQIALNVKLLLGENRTEHVNRLSK